MISNSEVSFSPQAEVILLGQLKHPHLVNLIGYCYEDEHRLLVYEYMERGSLENQLFKSSFCSSLFKICSQLSKIGINIILYSELINCIILII